MLVLSRRDDRRSAGSDGLGQHHCAADRAATAVAAKFLARRDARSATIVGCGAQGEIQLAAIAAVRQLEHAYVIDTDHARAEALAARATSARGLRVEATKELGVALRASDVSVTCTDSRAAFVLAADVAPGTFIAAVGADNHGKQELAPDLVASATTGRGTEMKLDD
jgi:alanine dehydrogenase